LKSWPNSCILLLILGTEPPWSNVQHEFGIQTISIQRLDISRQPWLKTLWESAIWVSILRPPSEKFLISILIAPLVDPKWLHPLLNLSEHLQHTCEHRQHVKCWNAGKHQLHGNTHARLGALTPKKPSLTIYWWY
jgi:hypothetical protein